MADSTLDPGALRASVRELPGGPELLELAARHPQVELVGGAIRDLALGRTPRELDVVVAGDAAGFAEELAALLRAAYGFEGVLATMVSVQSTVHDRFGTASVAGENARIDIATRRSERYPAPGALPEVAPGTPEQDLERRDFTINAIAISLSDPGAPVRAVPGALEDLAQRQLRVLYEQSFRDDPTRLLRLARYAARLQFEFEPRTAELAAQAVAQESIRSVSGARAGAELRLALNELSGPLGLVRMDQMGVLAQIDPALVADSALAARAFELRPPDARPDLLVLASLLAPRAPSRASVAELLERLEFSAGDRDRTAAAASSAAGLGQQLRPDVRPSQLARLVGQEPPEAVVLAGAIDPLARDTAWRWLFELRHTALRIGGDDLVAAGVKQGPRIGRALTAVLYARLDGELPDERRAQLTAALEAARE